MAAVVPLVAAVAGYGASTALGGGILGALGGFVVSSAINQIGGRAVAKKPKKAEFSAEAAGRTQIIRSSVESHKVIYGTAKVSGPLVFAKTVGVGLNSALQPVSGDNKFLHMVLPLAAHEIEDVTAIYLNDQPVTLDGSGYVQEAPYFDGAYSYVNIRKYYGTPDQTADVNLQSECGLTPSHRLRGIAYLVLRLEYNNDVFPLGIPNVSAVVKGKKVYDPRTGLTAWSDNAALCIRDYLTSRDGSALDEPYGFGCSGLEIDDASVIAAANVCDESVSTAAGGTQARYRCNGVVDTAAAPLDNLQSLVSSLAGAVTYVQGKFRVHAAAYDAPSGEITTAMLAGEVDFNTGPSRKELFNAVKGTYVDPARSWQPTDFPPLTNAIYQAQDGEQIARDLDLPFTTDAEAAQRIAKVVLEKGRQGITVTLPVNHSALKYSVYDVVTLTNAQLGWSSKPFRITRWKMGVPGPIILTLQEESSASYDWNSGEATVIDAAPDTTLPQPWNVAAPGVPSVTEELYETRNGGGVKAKAVISYAPSTSPFVRHYTTEYRRVGETEWTPLANTSATSLEVLDVQPGRYEVRTKAVNNFGVSSPFATAAPREIFGLGARPADITGLTMQAVSSLAVIQWNQPAELDVLIGGRILIRHSEATAGATWEESYSIGNPTSGSINLAVVPLKAGTYLVKAEDSSGLQSVNAAAVATKNATVLTFSALSSIQEDPLFAGTHSDTFADGGTLKLSGAGLFDDIPSLDAVGSLDAYGGVVDAGTYTFASGTDNGSVSKVRVSSSLEVQTINANDRIDSRTGNIDDWLDFDGTSAGSSVDAWVEARETDDNPLGTPAWGEWKRLDVADFESWGIQYRAQLRSYDPAYNIYVTQLRIYVEEIP